ncbi:Uncharacterised protein [Achromobacter xylosoxidans]|nr:Uncharacterised protein [Achromobacter xylosoxidans]
MFALEHGDEGADVVVARFERGRRHAAAGRQHLLRPHQAGALAPGARRQAGLGLEAPRQRARRHADPVRPCRQRARVGRRVRQRPRQPLQPRIAWQRQAVAGARQGADLVADQLDDAQARRIPRFVAPSGGALDRRQQQRGGLQGARRIGQARARRRAQVDAVAGIGAMRAQPMRAIGRHPQRVRGRRDPLAVAGLHRQQALVGAEQLPARMPVQGGLAHRLVLAAHRQQARPAASGGQPGGDQGRGGIVGTCHTKGRRGRDGMDKWQKSGMD